MDIPVWLTIILPSNVLFFVPAVILVSCSVHSCFKCISNNQSSCQLQTGCLLIINLVQFTIVNTLSGINIMQNLEWHSAWHEPQKKILVIKQKRVAPPLLFVILTYQYVMNYSIIKINWLLLNLKFVIHSCSSWLPSHLQCLIFCAFVVYGKWCAFHVNL